MHKEISLRGTCEQINIQITLSAHAKTGYLTTYTYPETKQVHYSNRQKAMKSTLP